MNAQAAEALFEAERKGVRQIRGTYADRRSGGLCALGVLGFTSQNTFATCRLREVYGFRQAPMDCPCCGDSFGSEFKVVYHMNDHHRLTFSEIARKLGPDHA